MNTEFLFAGSVIELVENNPLFNTSLSHSYKCSKKQTFNLTVSDGSVTGNVTGYISLQQVQLQAFRNATGTVFSEGKARSIGQNRGEFELEGVFITTTAVNLVSFADYYDN